MPLNRYLEKKNMKLLKKKVDLAIKMQLKVLPYWLISENCLKKQKKSSNKKISAIIIVISSKNEAKKLCTSGL